MVYSVIYLVLSRVFLLQRPLAKVIMMREVLEAINNSIIPDKKVCKSYNIKSSKNPYVERDKSLAGYLVNDMFYSGTLMSSSDIQNRNLNIRYTQRGVYFFRVVISGRIDMCFNRLHIYGSTLSDIYSMAEFGYDIDDPTSIDCASEKILQIFQAVREINRLTRRRGDFEGIAEAVRARFNIC